MDKSKDSRKKMSSKAGSSNIHENCGDKLGSTEVDRDKEGENELSILKQTYIRLVAARRAEEREAQEMIRRQSQLICSLSEEKGELLTSLAGVSASKKEDRHLSQIIHTLHLHDDEISDLISQENTTQACLQKEIRDVQKRIDKDRKGPASKQDLNRKIQQLTTRLAKANGKLSTLISTNASLRRDIDTMRGEKDTFLHLRRKLQKELLSAQQRKKRVLDEAIEHIDTWEEAHVGAKQVSDQRMKDEENHASEAWELRRDLCHAQKTDQFLSEKTKAREHDEAFLKAKERRELQERESRVELRVQLNRYECAVGRIGETVKQHGSKRRRPRSLEATAQCIGSEERSHPPLWEAALSRRRSTLVVPMLRAGAGGGGAEWERRGRRLTEHRRLSTVLPGLLAVEQERLKELARNAMEEQRRQQEQPMAFDAELFYNVYLEREEVNFALFTYVLEQNRMIEEMTGDMEQLKQRMEQQQRAASVEGQLRTARASETTLAHRRTKEAFGQIQANVERSERILHLVKAAITGIAGKTNVNCDVDRSVNWTDDTVTTRSLLFLLGQTEQQVTELLAARLYCAQRGEDGSCGNIVPVSSVLGISTPPMIENAGVLLPPISSETEEGEEGLRPLTRSQLLQIIHQRTWMDRGRCCDITP